MVIKPKLKAQHKHPQPHVAVTISATPPLTCLADIPSLPEVLRVSCVLKAAP